MLSKSGLILYYMNVLYNLSWVQKEERIWGGQIDSDTVTNPTAWNILMKSKCCCVRVPGLMSCLGESGMLELETLEMMDLLMITRSKV